MKRLVTALSRWLVGRHELHRSHAEMDRDLHAELNRNAALRKHNSELEWQCLELHHRIRSLEAQRQQNDDDWSLWGSELNGGT